MNYGGQQEIIDGVNAAIAAGEPVTLETFETYLDTGDLLPIDLMVRTSNENRISNFLLYLVSPPESPGGCLENRGILHCSMSNFAGILCFKPKELEQKISKPGKNKKINL